MIRYCMMIFFLQLGTHGQVQNLGCGLLGRRKGPSLTAIRADGLLMDRYRTMSQKISITPQFTISNFILQLSGLKLHLQTLKFMKSLISGKRSGTTEKNLKRFSGTQWPYGCSTFDWDRLQYLLRMYQKPARSAPSTPVRCGYFCPDPWALSILGAILDGLKKSARSI